MSHWTPAETLHYYESFIHSNLIDPDKDLDFIVLAASYDKSVVDQAFEHAQLHWPQCRRTTVNLATLKAPLVDAVVVPRYVRGYIGVDLDGTLAHYDGWKDGAIGEPIKLMAERMFTWIKSGQEVRIVTARGVDDERIRVQQWLWDKFRLMIPVQNTKTFRMHELWDDRAVQVVPNTGRSLRETL
jgi:hypothetical protein